MAYINNEFKSLQWATSIHGDTNEIQIQTADTWTTFLLGSIDTTNVYNDIIQDRGKWSFNGGKGWYVLNANFNAGGGGDALNKNLGMRFIWAAGESYEDTSAPLLWNNKGGNYKYIVLLQLNLLQLLKLKEHKFANLKHLLLLIL